MSSSAPESFGLGNTTVMWTATDSAGNSASYPQIVTVCDTTPPVMPAIDSIRMEFSIYVERIVTYVVPTALDTVDADVEVLCVPASGSVFPYGASPVECTATDDSGNSDTTRFYVFVSGN